MTKRELNEAEKATNCETMTHIATVRRLLDEVVVELIKRGQEHDASKLDDPELATFVEMTPKLRGSTYGSEEYKGFLRQMKPALEHHYAANRHHPEHFANGIRGMSLIDLIEMLCDWKAATLRHEDGDIWKSLQINKDRFSIPDELAKILANTVSLMRWGVSSKNVVPVSLYVVEIGGEYVFHVAGRTQHGALRAFLDVWPIEEDETIDVRTATEEEARALAFLDEDEQGNAFGCTVWDAFERVRDGMGLSDNGQVVSWPASLT